MVTTRGTERAELSALKTPGPRLKRRTDQLDDDQSDDGQERPTRKAPRKATQTRKRGTTRGDNKTPHDSKSVRGLAKPHLLAVTKVQLKVLNTNCCIGSNRQLDADRVSKLKNGFKKDGLKRTAQENWLLCVCNAADISKIWPDENSLDRGHCSEVIPQFVEVLNGQHRIAALRDYVSDTGNDEAELWWTCELYNQETLPKYVAQIMRFNPTESSARLNNAQVWRELVNLTSPAGDDRGGKSDAEHSQEEQSMDLDYSLIEAFRIVCEAEFPSRRLATLWNNRPWRRVMTQWYQTRLGIDTFAISFTARIACLRIEEYFFEMMDSTLNTLRSLPLDTAIHVSSSDWDQLADMYETAEDQTPDVLSTFYESAGSKRTRSCGFLTSLSDAEYDAFYQHMKTANHYVFPRPHRISRLHLEAMAQVLHHVIAWIDPEMITTLIQQSRGAQSKPLIRTYLRDALDNFAQSNGMPDFQASEEQAIAMQKSILEFAREQAAEFLACPIPPTFFTEPTAPDLTTIDYTTRFNTVVWTKLLHFMREYLPNVTGSPTLTFRQEWDRNRMADTLPTLSELPSYFSKIIANAKDPAAKAIVEEALQEALSTIRKPVRGQGASETAMTDSTTYFTGTSLEAASESLPTIEVLSRRDDKLSVTRQSPADRSVSPSSFKMIPSMPRQNAGTSADETEAYLDDPHGMDFHRDSSLSSHLDDPHGMDFHRDSSLSPHLDDPYGKKTILSIPSTAGDESTQQEAPDKHKQPQPPFAPQSSCSGPDLPPKPKAAHTPSAANLLSTSCDLTSSPNASASGNRKRGRKSGTLCWFRS